MDKKLNNIDKNENLYLTDLRFPNEIEVAKKHGFKIYKIIRDDELRIAAGATLTTHESETALNNYEFDIDVIIENNNTFDDLYEKINKTLVPHGLYCHGYATSITERIIRYDDTCPFYYMIPIPENELNGKLHPGLAAMGQKYIGGCKLLNITDDETRGLLWDQCKECGINED